MHRNLNSLAKPNSNPNGAIFISHSPACAWALSKNDSCVAEPSGYSRTCKRNILCAPQVMTPSEIGQILDNSIHLGVQTRSVAIVLKKKPTTTTIPLCGNSLRWSAIYKTTQSINVTGSVQFTWLKVFSMRSFSAARRLLGASGGHWKQQRQSKNTLGCEDDTGEVAEMLKYNSFPLLAFQLTF